MLDRVDAGANGDFRAGRAVRVRGRLLAKPVRFVHERVHLGLRELRGIDFVGERQHAPSRAHLDDVCAVLHLESHRIAKSVGPGRDALRRAGLRSKQHVRIARAVAVAAASAERIHGHQHVRARGHARVDRVPQTDVDVVGRPDVPHGGEPRHQRLARVRRGDDGFLGDRAAKAGDGIGVPVCGALERHVRVGVDEPGKQRDVAQIDHARAGRNRDARACGGDLAPLHHDDAIGDRAVAAAVEETVRLDDSHRRRRRRRRLGRRGARNREHAPHHHNPCRQPCAHPSSFRAGWRGAVRLQ